MTAACEKTTACLSSHHWMLQGIWELSCDRSLASRVSEEVLEALILALHVGPPAMQVVAMAAVWNLCVVAEVRGVLVQVCVCVEGGGTGHMGAGEAGWVSGWVRTGCMGACGGGGARC